MKKIIVFISGVTQAIENQSANDSGITPLKKMLRV